MKIAKILKKNTNNINTEMLQLNKNKNKKKINNYDNNTKAYKPRQIHIR